MAEWDGVTERRKKSLTEKDLEQIAALIQQYRCPMTVDEIEAVKALVGTVKEVGGGDIYKGSIRVRDNIKFIDRLMTKKSVVSGLALTAMFYFLIQKAVYTLWELIQQPFGK